MRLLRKIRELDKLAMKKTKTMIKTEIKINLNPQLINKNILLNNLHMQNVN